MKKILTLLFFLFSASIFFGQQSSRSEEQALALCDSLYGQLAAGKNFKKIAAQFSEDPGSKKNGGQYSNCEFGTFTPEFEAVVLQLQENQISKPFKSPYGYHIVQLIQKNTTTFTARHILITFQQ